MPNRVTYTFVLSDKFSRAARSISRRTKDAAGSMTLLKRKAQEASRGVAGAFATMKKAAIGFQASMAPLLAGLAGVAGVIAAFTVGTGFQDAMADLSSITGSTGKELEFLRIESIRLGKSAKVSAAETAEAFKLVASAKSELLEDPKALSQVTEQVLLLKNATGLDLATATQATTEALNQFGAGADQAARFVNVLAAGSKIGASEVFETQAAVRNSGVVAKQAGLSFEELNSAIQVLAKAGIKGGRAGNQLKGVLLSLETSANKKLRPGVVGVNQALENLKALQLDNIQLEKLFGRENIAAGSALAANATLVGQWSRELKGTNIAQEQANVRLATMTSKMRGLGVVISAKIIAVFDALSPALSKIADDLTAFFSSGTDGSMDGFIQGLSSVLDIMTALAKITGEVAGLLGPVIKAGGNVLSMSLAGVADLGTFITTGNLDASTSASFKNAQRVERSRADVNVNLNDPGNAVESVKTTTTGKTAGLNVGVNMATEGT